MPIKILELHHHSVRIGATQAEADAARDFYVNVLGLANDAGRPTVNGSPGHWIDVGDHAQIHLTSGSGAAGIAGTTGASGATVEASKVIDPHAPHVALAVADIAATREELERLGVPFLRRSHRLGEGFEQLFVRDPAGNLIELHQIGACRCAARSRPGGSYARAWGAVMFADMRGFTSIAERLSPAEVVPLLNEYFALLTNIAVAHGATVFNMAGDGLMAGFGVPREQTDAPERAIDSAREMLTRFRALASDWKRRLDIDTGLGIGINAGEMIVGNVGAPSYTSYTIIGDTVNVAARLSQRARAGEALFSSAVKRMLEEHGREISALVLPALQLRGRAAPIDIYCLPTEERIDFRPAAGVA